MKSLSSYRFYRQISAHFFLFCLFAALGCTPPHTVPLASSGVVISSEKEVLTLDPRRASDSYSVRLCRLIYEGLMTMNDQLEPVPLLARRYTVTDMTTYDFWLHKGVRFHNGSPLTVHDLIATYSYIRDPSNGSIYRNAFEKIAEMKAVSDYHLRIELREPFVPFLTALSIGIMPTSMADKEKPFQPIGNGPFKIADLSALNRKQEGIELVAFKDYRQGQVKIPKIVVKPTLQDSVRLLRLLKGRAHFVINGVPPILMRRVEVNSSLSIQKGQSLNYSYIGMNLRDPRLSQRAVRQALAHAIDRDTIIRYKLGGLATPATSMLSPAHYMHVNDLPVYKYDPKKAEALLDEAGFPRQESGQRFALSLKTSTNPARVEIAEVIATQLKAIGIQVELRSLEFGMFFEDVKRGNFDLFTLEWSGLTDPDIFHYVFHSNSVPPEGANRGHYSNSRIDQLVQKARKEFDREKRKELYAEVQRIIAYDIPYISLWYGQNIAVIDKRIENYHLNPQADYQPLIRSALKHEERGPAS